jgi:hypothetical protein
MLLNDIYNENIKTSKNIYKLNEHNNEKIEIE